jgi:GlpG protein
MRQIGQLENESLARRFAGFLTSRGITNEVEPGPDGRWAVWVHREDQLQPAREELDRFLANPQAEPSIISFDAALEAERRREGQAAGARHRVVDVRTRWGVVGNRRPGPLTIALIGLCILVAVGSNLGAKDEILQNLYMTAFQETPDGGIEWHTGLPEVRQGQVWRLVTPILIHYGVMHLVFNLLWLADLGGMIERRQGMLRLGLMVVAIGVLSNLAQFWVTGPAGGGMSGVVYGLFGYVWVRGKLEPDSGLFVTRQNTVIMMAWLVLCFTGILGPIGNWAHASGLGIGAAWGYLSSGHPGRVWRRYRNA